MKISPLSELGKRIINVRGLGKNQVQALQFFATYPGWHSISSDPITIRTINSLVTRKLIQRNGYMQASFVNS